MTTPKHGPDVTPSLYFPDSYAQARANFLAACQECGVEPTAHVCPRPGPDGADLFLDEAMFGRASAPAMLLVVSGTHGVEGFAGSGIQTGLLRAGLADRLGDAVGLVMVHALNPYGFAHVRRVNEDNIDLNRNFVDHSAAYATNPAYDEIAHAINLQRFTPLSRWRSKMRLDRYRRNQGDAALQAAISGGQYGHPTGLFYGGRSEAWSNQTFRWVVGTHLGQAERVILIDLHTGLGPRGHGEIISHAAPGTPEAARTVGTWGGRAKFAKAGTSVSAELSGTINAALVAMLPDAEVTAASLEFGTEPPMDVFWALQAENWLHHRASPSHRPAGKIKSRLREAFYPDEADWRAQVYAQAETVVDQALHELASA